MANAIKIHKSTWDSMHPYERDKYIYCPSQELAHRLDLTDPRDVALIKQYH